MQTVSETGSEGLAHLVFAICLSTASAFWGLRHYLSGRFIFTYFLGLPRRMHKAAFFIVLLQEVGAVSMMLVGLISSRSAEYAWLHFGAATCFFVCNTIGLSLETALFCWASRRGLFFWPFPCYVLAIVGSACCCVSSVFLAVGFGTDDLITTSVAEHVCIAAMLLVVMMLGHPIHITFTCRAESAGPVS